MKEEVEMRFQKSTRLALLSLSCMTIAHAAVACSGTATFGGSSVFQPSGGGGSVSFSFSGAGGCTYYVSSDSSWLTTSQSTAIGNDSTSATVTFTLASDGGAGRTGNLRAYVNGSVVASLQIMQNGTSC